LQRGKYKGLITTAEVLGLLEKAFFDPDVDDPVSILRDHKRVGYYIDGDGLLCWDPSLTVDRAKFDVGTAFGVANDGPGGERNERAVAVDAAQEKMRKDIEATCGVLACLEEAPVSRPTVPVPRRTRVDRSMYGLVITNADYLKAQEDEGARKAIKAAKAQARVDKAAARWETHRADIRAVEARVDSGVTLESLRVKELKALIRGRTGKAPKASNNTDDAMLKEARVALSRDLVLPPTPTKEDEPEESDEPLDVEEEAPGLA